jgi:hypothetical protein
MSESKEAGPGSQGSTKPRTRGESSQSSGSSAEPSGTSDQAIGRPGPWQEGRYEQDGEPVDQSVITPGGDAAAFRDDVSTPVTREDYEGKTGGTKPRRRQR